MENQPKFLQNNGKASVITVSTQKWVDYYDKKGIYHKIEIVMERDHDNNERANKEFRLSRYEKCLVYFDSGVYKRRVIRPKEEFFSVESWPHLLNVHCGTSKYDERIYNFKVGEIVRVDNFRDFTELFKQYHLLDEVNEKGEIIKKNIYTKRQENPEEKVDYSKVSLPEMIDIPDNSPQIRRTSGYEERIWYKEGDEKKFSLLENKDLDEEEKK